MADERHAREPQRVEHGAEIGQAGRQIVPVRRLAGGAVATAGDGQDVEPVGEPRGEVVEAVRDISKPREEDDRVT